MMTVERARQILGAAGEKLTDSEVLELLTQLYGIAEVACSIVSRRETRKRADRGVN